MLTARKTKAAAGRTDSVGFAIDRQRSVPHQVYEVLREKILTLQLKPGESINERWLADWLGVSRTPIREAINRLSANSLIAIVPKVGTTVALINVEKVKEFNFIRTSLESLIIRHAAGRFDDDCAVTLRGLIDRQITTLEAPDIIENIAVDNQFHHAIAKISGLTATWAVLQHVMDEILRVRHLACQEQQARRESIDAHLLILEMLRAKDPDRCEQAMKAHLDASFIHVVAALEQHRGYLEIRT
jgi:DNA-binding GntR family transcriptional regulator